MGPSAKGALLAMFALAGAGPAGCAGAFGGRPDASAHPLARKPAPAVVLKLEKGGVFRPADARGKVLLLDFWATWCQPCKASFPRVEAIYRKHGASGLEVVAVNEDEEVNAVPAFLAETPVTFTIAYDDEGKAAGSFGVQSMPSSYLVDRKGIVRYAHSGYHPDDAAQVEAEIEELLAESP